MLVRHLLEAGTHCWTNMYMYYCEVVAAFWTALSLIVRTFPWSWESLRIYMYLRSCTWSTCSSTTPHDLHVHLHVVSFASTILDVVHLQCSHHKSMFWMPSARVHIKEAFMEWAEEKLVNVTGPRVVFGIHTCTCKMYCNARMFTPDPRASLLFLLFSNN